MSIIGAGGTLGGRPIISVRAALRSLAKNGFDDSVIRGKANSFRCPIGEEPGRGWFLMVRSDVDAIYYESADDIVNAVLTAGNETVRLNRLLLVNAFRLTPGTSHDPAALYLVEVADKRAAAAMSIINRRYNLRGASGSLETETLNGGIVWTWDTLIEDIWGQNITAQIGSWSSSKIPSVFGTAYPVPGGAASLVTPENLRYEQVTAWHALCDAAKRIGCEVRYNPFATSASLSLTDNDFSIIEIGATSGQFGFSRGWPPFSPTPRTTTDLLLEDSEQFHGQATWPEKVAVCFPAFFPTSESFGDINATDGHGQFYTVEIGTNGNTIASGLYPILPQTGTRRIIFDQLQARFAAAADATPSNATSINARAYEIAYAFYASLYLNDPSRWVFSGLKQLYPGPAITEVIWREYGDGWKTEVLRYQTERAKYQEPPRVNSSSSGGSAEVFNGIAEDNYDAVSVSVGLFGIGEVDPVEAAFTEGLILSAASYKLLKVDSDYLVLNPELEVTGTALGDYDKGQVGDFNVNGTTVQATVILGNVQFGEDYELQWSVDGWVAQGVVGGNTNPNVTGNCDTFFSAEDGSGTFTTAFLGAVEATISRGLCLPGKDYGLVWADADHYAVVDPEMEFIGVPTATTLFGNTVSFTVYAGAKGSEATVSATVDVHIRKGLVYSGKKYRVKFVDEDWEVADYATVFTGTAATDISLDATVNQLIFTGAAGSETTCGNRLLIPSSTSAQC